MKLDVAERAAGSTARDYAYTVIRENLVSLNLAPGSILNDVEIAEALGISRTPVREAINQLKSESEIIEIYPQRGSYVALIDSTFVEEARFLRKTLDIAVIEEACDLATQADIDRLEENVALQEFYLQTQAADKIYLLDDEFHKLIYSAAKKETLHAMRSNIMLHFDRVRTLSMKTVKDTKIVGDHRQMLESIKKKDKESCRMLVEKHLSRYHIDEAEIRAAYPQYFKD